MYIYLAREEAKKGISLVVAVEQTQIADFKKKFGENTIEFIGDDLPHYITYLADTDTVREATPEERLAREQLKLKEDEIIIDGAIYTFDKKYQKIVGNKLVEKSLTELVEEGVITLTEVKNKKRDALKKIRDEKILENIDVHGSNFQVRDRDMENFEDVARAVRRERKQLTDVRAWILSDNSIKTFTYAQLLDVLDERALRKEKIFEEYAKYSMVLEKATSVEEIEKITWE